MAEAIGMLIGLFLCVVLIVPLPLAIWAVIKSF
jgi:hypothetical protein